MTAYLLSGIALGLSAAASPGPLQTFLMSSAATRGWQRTLPAAAAPVLSDGPIILLMLFILGRASDSLLLAIQIIGGLFLLYLAYVIVRVLRRPLSDSTAHTDSGQRTLFQAALTNLLNPNPYLFWGTVGVQTLVQGWREGPINGVSFLLGFYVLLIGGLAATIMLFGLAGGLGPRIRFALNALAAIILFGLGMYRIIGGAAALIDSALAGTAILSAHAGLSIICQIRAIL